MLNVKRLVLTGTIVLGFGLFGLGCESTEKTEDHEARKAPASELPSGSEHPSGGEHPDHPG